MDKAMRMREINSASDTLILLSRRKKVLLKKEFEIVG
jgi:hypothetical protein